MELQLPPTCVSWEMPEWGWLTDWSPQNSWPGSFPGPDIDRRGLTEVNNSTIFTARTVSIQSVVSSRTVKIFWPGVSCQTSSTRLLLFSLNSYPQCQLPVLNMSPPQVRPHFTRSCQNVAPPGSSSTVEEVADAELSEKFSVLCSALVPHQDVGVNLQQHKVKSAKISSSCSSSTSSAEPEVKNCVVRARQNLSGLIRQKWGRSRGRGEEVAANNFSSDSTVLTDWAWSSPDFLIVESLNVITSSVCLSSLSSVV